MCREQEEVGERHDTAKWKEEVPKDSQPDLCPIKILASEFACEDESAFARVDLYRAWLQCETHTILRELRKRRDETGDEEYESEPTEPTCSTGFQPVFFFKQKTAYEI